MEVVEAVAVLLCTLGFFFIIAIVWLIYKWKESQVHRTVDTSSIPPERKFKIRHGKIVPRQLEAGTRIEPVAQGNRSHWSATRPSRWFLSNVSLSKGDDAVIQDLRELTRPVPSFQPVDWKLSPQKYLFHPNTFETPENPCAKDVGSPQRSGGLGPNIYQYLTAPLDETVLRRQSKQSGSMPYYSTARHSTIPPVRQSPYPSSSRVVAQTENPSKVNPAHKGVEPPPSRRHSTHLNHELLQNPSGFGSSDLSSYVPHSKFQVSKEGQRHKYSQSILRGFSEDLLHTSGRNWKSSKREHVRSLDGLSSNTPLSMGPQLIPPQQSAGIGQRKIYSLVDETDSAAEVDSVETPSLIAIAVAVPLRVWTPQAALTLSSSASLNSSSLALQTDLTNESINTSAFLNAPPTFCEAAEPEHLSSQVAAMRSSSVQLESAVTRSSSSTSMVGEEFHTARPSPAETPDAEA